MDDPGPYLLMIGGLFLLGAVGEVIFSRTQIPDVVWLILAGVMLRATGLVDPSKLDAILPLFSALTLIIVLFDGGRQIVVADLVKAAPKATALALLSFTLSVLGVAVVLQLAALTGLLPDSWTFFHSLMVGAMVGGSSSLIIMPSMNLAKVEAKVSNLVGLESALTDALCVVVAVVIMNVIQSGEASGSDAVLELSKNFGAALAIGLVAGWTWMLALRALAGNPYAYPVTLAALLFLYVITDRLGGNPAMAVLTFSVIVGNADSLMKMVGFSLGDRPLKLDDTVVTVHTQAAFIIKSFFFTYIGLMLAPPFSLLLLGVVVGLVLLATRLPAVMMIARKPGFDDSERKMISISLPRGMAAGVLATLPASAKYKIEGTEDLPAMVFASVVTSIAIFAVGFRKVRAEAAQGAGADASSEPGAEPDTPPSEPEPDTLPSEPGPDMPPSEPGQLPPGRPGPQMTVVQLEEQRPAQLPAPADGATSTQLGLPPAGGAEPPAKPQASTKTAPGMPVTTLTGLPATPGGPPPPEARPGVADKFKPAGPSQPAQPRATPSAPRPGHPGQPIQPPPELAPTSDPSTELSTVEWHPSRSSAKPGDDTKG